MRNQRGPPLSPGDFKDDTASALPLRKKVAFSVTCVLGFLIALELLCRSLGLGGPHVSTPIFSDWHGTPDGRVFWIVRGAGRNSEGMQDHEHVVEKPPGTARIVCLGDSVTEGWGAGPLARYPALLESFMQQTGLNVEVITVATAGWSTLQEVAAYEQIARKYQPDFVFLGFCLNDVAEMYNNLQRPPNPLIGGLARHSALFRALVNAEGRQIRAVEELFADPPPQSVSVGWQRVEAELDRLARETGSEGIRLSVLVFPFRSQLEQTEDAGGLQPLPQRRLTSFCLKRGIPSLDLLPAFRAAGEDAFIDESHFSALGARVVAEEVIRWGRTGCEMCGYDLSNVTEARCPRCGSPIKR